MSVARSYLLVKSPYLMHTKMPKFQLAHLGSVCLSIDGRIYALTGPTLVLLAVCTHLVALQSQQVLYDLLVLTSFIHGAARHGDGAQFGSWWGFGRRKIAVVCCRTRCGAVVV